MENIVVKKADKKDVSQIHKLLEYILDVHYSNRPDLFRNEAKYNTSEIEALIKNEDYYVLVAKDNDVVLGYLIAKIIISKTDKKVLYVDDLCVNENSHGSGIGKKLMDEAKAYAIENDFDRIELNVYEFNKNALAFYERLGYKTQRREMEIVIK